MSREQLWRHYLGKKWKIAIKTDQYLNISLNFVRRHKSDRGTTYQTGFSGFQLKSGILWSQLGPKFENRKIPGKFQENRENPLMKYFFKLKWYKEHVYKVSCYSYNFCSSYGLFRFVRVWPLFWRLFWIMTNIWGNNYFWNPKIFENIGTNN